jgi:hypothetical protein
VAGQGRTPRSAPASATGRDAADPGPSLDHLTLPELRDYRTVLAEEADRVSYWRRIFQARIDILSDAPTRATATNLAPVLGRDKVTATHRILSSGDPSTALPPLPNLQALWERSATPGSDEARSALIEELRVVERRLSDYRHALHARLDAATAELVSRYRTNPALVDSALPRNPLGERTAIRAAV